MNTDDIILKSNDYRISKVLKRTFSMGLEQLKEGMIIRFQCNMKGNGRNTNGLYAQYVDIYNAITDEYIATKSFNSIKRVMSSFVLEVI